MKEERKAIPPPPSRAVPPVTPKALARLRTAVTLVKHELSDKHRTTLKLDHFDEQRPLEMNITRIELEKAISPDLYPLVVDV